MRLIIPKVLRKKLLLLGASAFLFFAPPANAQVNSYSFTQTTGTYTPITGGSIVVTNTDANPAGNDSAAIDDFGYAAVTIPFTFTFNGVPYTSFRTGSNGYIYFGSTASITNGAPISATDVYAGAVSGFGADLMGPQASAGNVTSGSTVITNVDNTTNCTVGATIQGSGIPANTTITAFTATTITLSAAATSTATASFITWTAGEIRVETVGTAPNRTCVIQFKNMALYSGSVAPNSNTGINFQIRLNEGGGVAATQTMNVVYGNSFAPTGTATVQVGLRGASNADFNNRSAAAGWAATIPGSTNGSTTAFSATSLPASGLIYTWTPSSCFVPSAVLTSAITLTGVTLNWTAASPAPASGYQYEVRSSGAGGSGATGLGVSGSTAAGVVTANVTGLTAATTYTVYVRSNCGGTFSNWTAGTTFITLCNPISVLPWLEGFEGLATTGATTFPPCWLKQNGDWRSADAAYNSDNDPRTGTKYITESWSATNEWMWTPGFQLTAGTSYDFKFWFVGDAYTGWTGDVGYNSTQSGTGATLMGSSFITSATASSTTYQQVIRSFTPATTGTYYFGIRVNATSNPDYLGFDDFELSLTPACSAPTLPLASAITNNSATVGWTASVSTPANGYQYEVRSSGAAGSGATGLAASGNTAAGVLTANVTGLTGSTTYSLYVRSVCAVSTFSAWTLASTFTTLCNATAIPYTQGFDVAGLPSCWTRSSVSGSATWASIIGTSGDIPGPHSGAGFMEKDYPTSQAILYSPGFTLSSLPVGGQARVKMWLYRNTAAHANDRIQVYVNNSTSLTGAATLLDIYTLSTTAPTVAASGWYEYIVNIPTSFNAGTVYIIFQGTTTAGFSSYDLGVDDFTVEQLPGCLEPSLTVASAITNNSATIGWTAPATPPANGYQYEVRTSGAAGSGATGLVASGNTAAGIVTANITGLAAITTYSVYVRSVCAVSTFSPWTSPYTFMTGCSNSILPFAENFATYLPSVCWSEATGTLGANTTLTGTSSGWNQLFYMNTGSNSAARINLYSNTKHDWVITPTIDLGTTGSQVLEFNFGLTQYLDPALDTLGSDDSVAVVISTNNGASWSTANILKVFTAANTPVSATGSQRYYLPLNGYTGLVKIGFYGSEGSVDDAKDNDIFIDSVLITTCTKPVVALGNDTVLCPGKTLNLSSGAATTYAWSTSATTQSIAVSAGGTYSVTAATANPGCFARDTIVVTAGVNPVVNLGNDTAICPGATITLNAGNAGSTYVWSNTTTAQTLNTTTAGTYFVTVKNTTACTTADTIVIGNGIVPNVNLGNDTTVCSNAQFTLNAGTGSSYLWSTGAVTQTIPVAASGTFIVAVKSSTACLDADTIVVTVNPMVAVSTITSLVAGASVSFTSDATDAVTYAWDFGDTGTETAPSPSHTYAANGVYTVRIVTVNPCGSDTAYTTVTITGVGINNPALNNNIKIYPNPAVNKVLIESNGVQMTSFSIFNHVGALVKENRNMNAHQETIDVSILPTGIYLLRINTANGSISRKLEIRK